MGCQVMHGLRNRLSSQCWRTCLRCTMAVISVRRWMGCSRRKRGAMPFHLAHRMCLMCSDFSP